MKINLTQQASAKLSNLLAQLPISSQWIAEEIVATLNSNEIKEEDDKNEATTTD